MSLSSPSAATPPPPSSNPVGYDNLWIKGSFPAPLPNVTIDAENAQAIDILREFSKQTMLSIAMSNDIKETISVRIINRPPKEALLLILKTAHLSANIEDHNVIIERMPVNTETIQNDKQEENTFYKKPDKAKLIERKLKTLKRQAQGEDRYIQGQNLVIQANEVVEGDVVVQGGNLTVLGNIEGDAIVLGGNLEVKDSALVEGDISVTGGSAILKNNARVEGDAIIVGGELEIQDNAHLEGKRTQLGGNMKPIMKWLSKKIDLFSPHRNSKSTHFNFKIGNHNQNEDTDETDLEEDPNSFKSVFFKTLLKMLLVFILGSIMLFFFSERIERVGDTAEFKLIPSFITGLVILLLSLPTSLILLISIMGIPFIPLFICGLGALIIFGFISALLRIGKKLPLFEHKKTQTLSLILGIVLFFLTSKIYIIGKVIVILVTCVSTGAVVLSHMNQLKPIVNRYRTSPIDNNKNNNEITEIKE